MANGKPGGYWSPEWDAFTLAMQITSLDIVIAITNVD